jgi:DUF4097 and DUF4098 domain-containing protein YvlB
MPHSSADKEHNMSSFETPHPIVLSVELSHGTVQLIAGDRTDTVIAVNPSDRDRREDIEAAEKIVVDHTNGTLSITGPKPRGFAVVGWGRSGSVDVTVELPEGSSLRADTGVADFRCHGRLDEVSMKTGVGNIRLDQTGVLRVHSGVGHVAVGATSGSAEIVTAGDMIIGTIAGDADIKNRNGKTSISRVDGDAKVRSANGDVSIDDARRDVTVKTANGVIRLGRVTRGSVSLETGSGALEIGIQEGTAAWIDATTKFGQVRNMLTPTDRPEGSADTVEVRASTAFGDVLITRSQGDD